MNPACALVALARCRRRGRLSGASDHADRALGAGGGTDATARIIGTLLEKELGQPVNVVNRTGGSGVVGHSAIAQARARRLHDRHDHRRDRDDALAGADRPRPARRTRRSRWSTPTRPASRCAPIRRTRP